jgi:hypothetical protein
MADFPLLVQAAGPAQPDPSLLPGASPAMPQMLLAQAAGSPPVSADPADLRADVVPEALATVPSGLVPDAAQATALASLPASWQNRLGNVYGLTKVGESTGVSQTRLPEEAKTAFRQADAVRQEAAAERVKLGNLEQQAAYDEAKQREAQAAELDAFSASENERLAAHQERMGKLQVDADTKQAAALSASKSADPSRIMKGWSGVMAAVAAGLGAYGATLGRTQNFAQQVLDAAIERDWQRQKEGIRSLEKDVSVAQQQIQTARELFSDVTAQKQYYRANMLAIGAQNMEALAARNKGNQAGQRALIESQNLWAVSKQALGESLAKEAITTQRSSSFVAGGAGAGGTTGVEGTMLGQAKEISEARHKIAEANQPVLSSAQAQTQEETLKDAISLGSSLQDATDLLQLIKSANAAGASAPRLFDNDTNIARATDLFLNPVLKRMGGSAISDQELERFRSAAGQGKGAWRSETVQKGLEKFVNSALREAQRRINGLPEQTREHAWRQLESAMGEDVSAFRSLRAGKWDTAAESAAKLGLQPRR